MNLVFLIHLIFFLSNTHQHTVTDFDENVYRTVKIGSQVWMSENLKATHFNNGVPVKLETNNKVWNTTLSGIYCNYNNKDENADVFGRLYNYYVVVDTNNICPLGWHVPTDEEWVILINYLGGFKVASSKMKEVLKNPWIPKITSTTNEIGFCGIPSGAR